MKIRKNEKHKRADNYVASTYLEGLAKRLLIETARNGVPKIFDRNVRLIPLLLSHIIIPIARGSGAVGTASGNYRWWSYRRTEKL